MNGMRVPAVYTGFAPIATCHWQSLANIAAAYGLADAGRSLCPSWGFSVKGHGVLAGSGRWPQLLDELYGLKLEQHNCAQRSEWERSELDLARAGIPFVAEIDAFYVDSPYQDREHVVHTVVVTQRDEAGAVILDTTNNPVPTAVPLDVYRLMRETDCVGRLEPRKLYVAYCSELRHPAPTEVYGALRRDLLVHGDADLAALDGYLGWYARAKEQVNVPRAAGERFAAAKALYALVDGGLSAVAPIAAAVRQLSDDWYMVHMLATHPRGDEPRQRERILRLMTELARAERSVHARVHRLEL